MAWFKERAASLAAFFMSGVGPSKHPAAGEELGTVLEPLKPRQFQTFFLRDACRVFRLGGCTRSQNQSHKPNR